MIVNLWMTTMSILDKKKENTLKNAINQQIEEY